MLPTPVRRALSTILERLHGSSLEWRIRGSVALAPQGLEISPHDVDLFLPSGDAAHLMAEILGEFVESPPHRRASEPFASYYGHCRIEGMEIDLIGELVIETPQGACNWGRIPCSGAGLFPPFPEVAGALHPPRDPTGDLLSNA